MKSQNQPLLETRSLCACYPKSPCPSLRNASFQLYPGELLAVLGPNGAGKTTLVNTLTGLLPISSGSVHLFGSPLHSFPRRELAKRVAVVQQNVQLAFGFSVYEVVLMGRAPHQGALLSASENDHQIVSDALERTDLLHLANRTACELSGGEQKRVAIARAFAQQPQILILDEATAHLDVRHVVELHALVRRELRTHNIACLAIMHDLNEAAQNAHRILILKNGEVRAQGTIPEVMTYRILRDTFDVDLYVGVNELDQTRYFVPIREDLLTDRPGNLDQDHKADL